MAEIINMKDPDILHAERSISALHGELQRIKSDISDKENRQLTEALSTQEYAAIEKEIKGLRDQEKSKISQIQQANKKLAELRDSLTKLEEAEGEEKAIIDGLHKLNANYIASEGAWHAIYTHGSRMDIKISVVPTERMIDMILGETGVLPSDARTLKKIAKSVGRYYQNVERSFKPSRPQILNEMTEIRKFWIQPVYGVDPHPAFDILINTIVGSHPEYKAQLEKTIAYRYLFPEDVIKFGNPDSTAPGGTGRDTLFDILRMIHTGECIGEVAAETFHGTHNGDLWGKIWAIVSDQKYGAVEESIFKNLTGGYTFRLRRMNRDAETALRTFVFFGAGNGTRGIFPLVGGSTGGASNEDRRVEPYIANKNLKTVIMETYEGVTEENISDVIQGFHEEAWKNETAIAEWLGHIIEKHDVQNMTNCWPIHKEHYTTMVGRKKDTFKTFMEAVTTQPVTNVYPVKDMYKIFQVTTGGKLGKNEFKAQFSEWLTRKTGNEWKFANNVRYYAPNGNQLFGEIVYDVEQDANAQRRVYAINEYIDTTAQNAYGDSKNDMVTDYNIKAEYY